MKNTAMQKQFCFYLNYIPIVSKEEVRNQLGYLSNWFYSVDCGQVGFNRNKELKAFDYGLH